MMVSAGSRRHDRPRPVVPPGRVRGRFVFRPAYLTRPSRARKVALGYLTLRFTGPDTMTADRPRAAVRTLPTMAAAILAAMPAQTHSATPPRPHLLGRRRGVSPAPHRRAAGYPRGRL